MAKKDNFPNGVQCENADNEILRRQVQRLSENLADFTSKFNEWMENQSLQQPMLPMSPEPVEQGPLEASLPSNLARTEDLETIAKAVGKLNTTMSTIMDTLSKMNSAKAQQQTPGTSETKELIETTAEQCGKTFIEKTDEKIKSALNTAYVRGQKAAIGISYEDAATIGSRLGNIEESIVQGKRNSRMKTAIWILSVTVAGLIAAVVLLGIDDHDVRKERNELRNVEWLYRDVRSCLKQMPQWLIADEKKMLYGTDEQRDSIKTEIFNREATSPQFLYFKPHDHWTPPPKKTKQQEEKNDTGHWYDVFFTPTENEKAAQEALRNNPNIPEGAKP